MLSKTHLFIVKEALKLTHEKFKKYERYIEKGCIEEEDVLAILKEMIDEREKDEEERKILKSLITEIYNNNRGK